MTKAATEPEPPAKSGKLPLLLALGLALAGAGGGYAVVSLGLLPLTGRETAAEQGKPDQSGASGAAPAALPDIAFVPLDTILITFGGQSAVSHLRFRAELEVAAAYAGEVESIRPRVVDVLNSYLRALDVAELANPAALARLRAQMLRRSQIVAGAGRVRDLLIMDFVLN